MTLWLLFSLLVIVGFQINQHRINTNRQIKQLELFIKQAKHLERQAIALSDYQQWAEDVNLYLSVHLGIAYREQFNQFRLTRVNKKPSEQSKTAYMLKGQIYRLHDIIIELRRTKLHASFKRSNIRIAIPPHRHLV